MNNEQRKAKIKCHCGTELEFIVPENISKMSQDTYLEGVAVWNRGGSISDCIHVLGRAGYQQASDEQHTHDLLYHNHY